jgi:SynChlorMet cassette radical SAM/SPASM protein ScmF
LFRIFEKRGNKELKPVPKLVSVYLYLSDYCNLNCRHCWINPSHTLKKTKRGMDIRLLRRILDQCAELGMRSVKITGGEPLLYGSFDKLLSYLKKYKRRLFIHMETNGTLITKTRARTLKESGMRFLSISIDGANSHTHDKIRGVKGSHKKALKGAKHLIENGIPVQFIMAVCRENMKEFEDLIKLAQKAGAESVKANFISELGRGSVMKKNDELLSLGEMLKFNKKIESDYRKKYKIRICSSLPVAFNSFSAMLKERAGFCSIKNLLGVLSSGKISICGIGEEIEELILGDAREDRIKDIWENSPVLAQIRENLPDDLSGICSNCLFKSVCLGHCVAHSYYRTGNLNSSYWFCEEASAKGLFPESRLINKNMALYHENK